MEFEPERKTFDNFMALCFRGLNIFATFPTKRTSSLRHPAVR